MRKGTLVLLVTLASALHSMEAIAGSPSGAPASKGSDTRQAQSALRPRTESPEKTRAQIVKEERRSPQDGARRQTRLQRFRERGVRVSAKKVLAVSAIGVGSAAVLGGGAAGIYALATYSPPPPNYPYVNAASGSLEQKFNIAEGKIPTFSAEPTTKYSHQLNDPRAAGEEFHNLSSAVVNGDYGQDPKFVEQAIKAGETLSNELAARTAAVPSHTDQLPVLARLKTDVDNDVSLLKLKLATLAPKPASVANPNAAGLAGPSSIPSTVVH